MTTTSAQSGLTPQLWDDKFFTSYVRSNQFARYMGTSEYDMIQVKQDLTKKRGDSVTYALVNDLTGAGKTGSATLKGYEEAMMSRSQKVSVDLLRHAVTVHEWDEQKSAIDLRDAAKGQLRSWATKRMRNDIVNALKSINGVTYAYAGNGTTTGTTEAQKDAWLVDNSDRVLFGASVSHASYTDHSADLALLTNADDKLTYSVVSLAKRLAKKASPAIRPIELNNGEEWFVLFAGPLPFRDLKASLATIHADAAVRGAQNPLFHDGDLMYDGVIIREIPEMGAAFNSTTDIGNGIVGPGCLETGKGYGAIDVATNFLCGAQALACAWAQRTTSRTDIDDYGAQFGVAIQEIRGIKKLTFGKNSSTDTSDLVDHGVLTLYTAAVADA
jgi:N4-gp56 family major capsid protein